MEKWSGSRFVSGTRTTYRSDGTVVESFPQNVLIRNREFSQSSVKTAGWPRSPEPDNPYSHSIVDFYFPVCPNFYRLSATDRSLKTIVEPQTGGELWNYNSGSLPLPVADYPQSEAVAKLLSRIKDQKINIAQAAAESRMTVAMIGDTARRLANAFVQLKKFNVVGAVNTLRYRTSAADYHRLVQLGRTAKIKGVSGKQFASNTWLELQYGWKPLLSDVYGACDQLAKTLYGGGMFFETSGSASNQKGFSDSSWRPSMSGALARSGFARGTASFRSTYKVRYRVNSQRFADANAVGLTNPLQLVWELLPYSFVVDWFLPVGQFLSTLDATVGYSFVSGTYTSKTFGLIVYQATFVEARDTGGYDNNGTLFFERHRDGKSRTLLSGFPAPQFPRPKNPFSSSHLTSALALMQQAFGRTPGRT